MTAAQRDVRTAPVILRPSSYRLGYRAGRQDERLRAVLIAVSWLLLGVLGVVLGIAAWGWARW